MGLVVGCGVGHGRGGKISGSPPPAQADSANNVAVARPSLLEILNLNKDQELSLVTSKAPDLKCALITKSTIVLL